MRPVYMDTKFGVFVGLDNYTSRGYYEWINKKAKDFIKSGIEVDDNDVYIEWLAGEANRSANPVEQDRLKDLIISKKLIDEKHFFDNYNDEYIGYLGYWDTWEGAIYNARQEKIKMQQPISVRGLDHVLYKKAVSQAVLEGKNIGEWLNIAIADKLTHSHIGGEERKNNSMQQ